MYKAVLFSRDGDWVTDFSSKTKEEVITKLADVGSKWIFFPITFIIKDHGGYTTSTQRIVGNPYDFQYWDNRTIKTISEHIKNLSDTEYQYLVEGYFNKN